MGKYARPRADSRGGQPPLLTEPIYHDVTHQVGVHFRCGSGSVPDDVARVLEGEPTAREL